MNLRFAALVLLSGATISTPSDGGGGGGGGGGRRPAAPSSALVASALPTAARRVPPPRGGTAGGAVWRPAAPPPLSMVLSDLPLEEYVRSKEYYTDEAPGPGAPRRSATGIPLKRRRAAAAATVAGASAASAASPSPPPAPPRLGVYSSPDRGLGRKEGAPAKLAVGGPKGGSSALHWPYESAIEALRAYHLAHGDLVIPRRFVVPSSSAYPEEWHGVDLAGAVYDMRWWQLHVRSHTDRVAELNGLGFVWERLQPEWNLVLEALVAYSMAHGHVAVPSSFVVPHGDGSWPKATWGINLGNCVHRIRMRHDFLRGPSAASRKAQLDGLGFVWDVNERAFQRTYRALRHFRRAERRRTSSLAGAGSAAGDEAGGRLKALRVPSTFVVPSGEGGGWPEDLWGLPLGAKCSAIRHKGLYVKNNPDRQRALEELGFRWTGNAALGWLRVVHAAAIYSRLHGRVLDVPIQFVVPAPPLPAGSGSAAGGVAGTDDAWPWPEQLWGFPLGQRLKDVRLKGAYLTGEAASSRRAQLDALGFNWTPKRGRRRRSQG